VAGIFCKNCGLENVSGRKSCKRCQAELDYSYNPAAPVEAPAGFSSHPSLSPASYSGQQWEYVFAEFGLTPSGWQLQSINDQQVKTPLLLSAYGTQAGEQGWELVSSVMGLGIRESGSLSINDLWNAARGRIDPDNVFPRMLLTFKRPKP
jgi:hypothetical protein